MIDLIPEKFKDDVSAIFEELVNTPFGRASENICEHQVLSGPTRTCFFCYDSEGQPKPLSKHNNHIVVRYFTVTHAEKRYKMTLRCDTCKRNYNINQYGTKGNFRLYEQQRPIIEVTDGVIVDRQLFDRYVNMQ